MSRKHEYRFYDGQIPSFMWHEKGVDIEHSLNLGGSLVIDFAEGRIVGFEIYDLNIGLGDGLKDQFKDTNEIEIRTEEEIAQEEIPFKPDGTPVCPDCKKEWNEVERTQDSEDRAAYKSACNCRNDDHLEITRG